MTGKKKEMIVIVDDQAANLKVLFSFLQELDFDIRILESGEELMEMLSHTLPDIILLDVMMPGIDGFTVCRKIKENPRSAAIPVIFLTALDEVEDKVAGFEAGGIDYITKPFQKAEVLARLKTHLTLQSKQREAEQALEQQGNLTRIIEKSLNEIFLFDATSYQFVFVNEGACENSGYSLSEFQQMTPIDIQPGVDRAFFMERILPLQNGQREKIIFETIFRRKDGSTYQAEVHLQQTEYDSKTVFAAIILDISQRKQMEQKYQDLVERSSDLITQVDSRGNILFSNHISRKIFGVAPEKLIGKSVFQFIHPDDQKLTTAWFKKCLSRKLPLEKIENRQVNMETGAVHDMLWTVNFHYDDDEQLVSVNGIARDITLWKQAEKQLLLSEKMTCVAGLAAGIAHEINTPLSGILQSIQVIEMELAPDSLQNLEVAARHGLNLPAVHAYFKEKELDYFLAGISSSAITAAEVIKGLLDFSRPHKGHFSTHNLNELIRDTLLLARSDYTLKKQFDIHNITIREKYDPACANVTCEATEIQHVMFNLIKNAVQAMLKQEGQKCFLSLRTQKTNTVIRIEVEDNGPGMDRVTRSQIFNPFFTTKEVGSATGLGLSVSYSIICDKHHGKIWVESVSGKGSRFIVELPLSQNGSDTETEKKNE